MFNINIVDDPSVSASGVSVATVTQIKDAIELAASVWGQYIDAPNAEIDILFSIEDIPGNPLATAGSGYSSFNGGPWESDVMLELAANADIGVGVNDGTLTVDLSRINTTNFYFFDDSFEADPAGLPFGQVDFNSVMVHEFGHILGLAIASNFTTPFELLTEEIGGTNFFTGANAVAANGGNNVELTGSHLIAEDLLDPSSTNGERGIVTPVHVGIWQDLGAQIVAPTSGADSLWGFESFADILSGDGGNDTLFGLTGDDTINGDGGDDVLNGGGGGDLLIAGTGNDTIYGDEGDDRLRGNSGLDEVFGGEGDDRIDGASGGDTLNGGSENDTISGQGGNDVLRGDDGNDTVRGGGGLDTVYGSQGNDRVDGNAGDDMVFGGDGFDFLSGGSGNDDLDGGAGDDTLAGNSGDDTMNGGQDNDSLNGGSGNDSLLGGTGDDTLTGARGDDTLTGEMGSDTFIFGNNSNADVITDFELAVDALHIDDNLYNGTLTVEQMVTTYGSNTGNGVAFDFGNGDTINVVGVGVTTGAIVDDIMII